MRLIARANYRQSCVNLDDGVLQRTWHGLNEYLHLCGVGLTGIVQWEYFNGILTYDSVSKVLETLGLACGLVQLTWLMDWICHGQRPSPLLNQVALCPN